MTAAVARRPAMLMEPRAHSDQLVRLLLDIEDPAFVGYAHDLAAAHLQLLRAAAEAGYDTLAMKRDAVACNAVLRDRFVQSARA